LTEWCLPSCEQHLNYIHDDNSFKHGKTFVNRDVVLFSLLFTEIPSNFKQILD